MNSFKSVTFALLFISFIGFEAKKCNKKKKCRPETKLFNVSSLEEDHVAQRPSWHLDLPWSENVCQENIGLEIILQMTKTFFLWKFPKIGFKSSNLP